jgi:tyrosine-protein kinase
MSQSTESSAPPLVDEELDLRRYRDVLWRRKWQVAIVVVVVVAAAALYTASQATRYRANTEVLLRPSTTEQVLGAGDSAPASLNALPVNVQTEIEYMKSRTVRDAVRKKLGYEPSVVIATVGDTAGETEVVSIRATNVDATRAAKEANLYAQTYTDIRRNRLAAEYTAAAGQVGQQVEDLTKQLHTLDAPLDAIDAQIAGAQSPQQVTLLVAQRSAVENSLEPERDPVVSRLDRAKDRVASLELAATSIKTSGAQIISAAEVPDHPYTPQPLRNGVLAILVGLILGCAIALLREALDDRVRSVPALELVTGWPVIGSIPKHRGKQGDTRGFVLGEGGSPVSDAYQMLRTSLQFEGLNRTVRVIMVTSAMHGEGKSTAVANLGVTLALDGNRVLLLDCDLRHHRLHEFFEVGNDPGLASVLTGRASVGESIVEIDAGRLLCLSPEWTGVDSVIAMDAKRLLSLLPAGPTPLNPSELLASRRAAEVFHELRERFDYILVDSPPVLPVSDVAALTKHVDGVLFLTNDAESRQGAIQRAVRLLKQVDAPVIGAVVNGTPGRQWESSSYYDLGGFYPGATNQQDLSRPDRVTDDKLPVRGSDAGDRG